MNAYAFLYRSSRVLALVVALSAGLAACSSKSPDEFIASAKGYLAKNDLNAAIIELKNALQRQPDLAEARFLLGKALLDRGDPVGAAVELRKSRELKHSDDEVVPLLADALLKSGGFQQVLDLDGSIALTTSEATAATKTAVARAHAALGDSAKADAAVSAALRAKADYAPALLLRARALAQGGNLDSAAKIVDEVLATAPDDVDALKLSGDIRYTRRDVDGAAALYRKALSAKPPDIATNDALMTLLLTKGDLEGAASQLASLKKVRPGHPLTIYFEARLASQRGDFKSAGELVPQLLKVAPENPQYLQLAGIVAQQSGDRLQAERQLGKVVQMLPDSVSTRHLRAKLYLQSGEPGKALRALEPLVDAASPAAETLVLAGTANLLLGDPAKAHQLFQRAVKLGPGDVNPRVGLAMAKIARGDLSEGLSALENIAETDSGTIADMALISASVAHQKFDGALSAIDRLEKKQPGTPLPLHLRAQVLVTRGDLAGARSNYEKALASDAKFFPSADGLSALDLLENKPEKARARAERFLAANPNDVRAILSLATIDEREGKPSQAVAARIAKAVAIKRNDPVLRRQLITYYMRKEDYGLAVTAAQEAVAALPDDPEMLALLGGTQLAAGDASEALATYGKVQTMRPGAVGPLIGIANAQIAMRAYDAARQTTKKAAALAPEWPEMELLAIRIDLLAEDYGPALVKARALQAKFPKAAIGFSSEGAIEAHRRNWAAAASSYRAALQREPSTPVAQQLDMSLRRAGDLAHADAFAADWVKKYPRDFGFVFFLVSLDIQERKYEVAQGRLEDVLRVAPENSFAVNQLAWVLATQHKPGALEQAERANQLSPGRPAFMDTYAMILAEQGQLAHALEVQKKAVEIAPNSPVFRLRLARLYLQSGDKRAAREELNSLQKLGERFPQHAEVSDLLSKL
jgi:putative PEP-CTERM system TPR-repeat lipoprotein